MAMFKAPTNIPQDLLLIQELIADTTLEQRPAKGKEEPDSDSSSSDSSSDISSSSESATDNDENEEAEVIEELLDEKHPELGSESLVSEKNGASALEFDSSSSSNSSDSEDEAHDGKIRSVLDKFTAISDDEDENEAGPSTKNSALRTKNEIQEPDVVVPDITEVGEDEPLEKIGTVSSIIDNVVIVRGLPSAIESKASQSKASERALDSESLLVFEDRKVLGYVNETFGPTYLPMYLIKFPSASAIDTNIVSTSREVFHVPSRSHFVFPSQLRMFKGSDASNVHDEEVGADEMEFSDDEAEAAYKRQLKRKRDGGRRGSISSSRASTPTPSHQRDQEMNEGFYSSSPYGEYSPYDDVDPSAGPSRPAPLPYDDPYQEGSPAQPEPYSPLIPSFSTDPGRGGFSRESRERGRGRGRGRDGGRGRERGRGGRGRGGHPRGQHSFNSDRSNSNSTLPMGRSLSPTSAAIARATGQYESSPPSLQQSFNFNAGWQPSFSGSVMSQEIAQQPQPRPHINPRFFGFNTEPVNPQQGGFYGAGFGMGSHGPQYKQYNPGWSGTWGQNNSQPPYSDGDGYDNQEYVP